MSFLSLFTVRTNSLPPLEHHFWRKQWCNRHFWLKNLHLQILLAFRLGVHLELLLVQVQNPGFWNARAGVFGKFFLAVVFQGAVTDFNGKQYVFGLSKSSFCVAFDERKMRFRFGIIQMTIGHCGETLARLL